MPLQFTGTNGRDASRAVGVNEPRDDFLADARLAKNQHLGVRSSGGRDFGPQRRHRGAFADERQFLSSRCTSDQRTPPSLQREAALNGFQRGRPVHSTVARVRAREMQLHGAEAMEQPFEKQARFDETIDARGREGDDADVAAAGAQPVEQRNLLIELQPRCVEEEQRSGTIEGQMQGAWKRTDIAPATNAVRNLARDGLEHRLRDSGR